MKRCQTLSVLAFCLAPCLADAQSMTPYYRGKELRIVVGYAAGGGYDTYARVIASTISKHIPGQPAVIVQNMPGADGLTAANYMARLAPRDGSAIAVTNRNLPVAPLLGLVERSSVQYDPKQFMWLANLNSEVSVLIVRSDLGLRTIEDIRTRELTVGSTGQTSNNAIYPHVINHVLGTRLKVVTGYPGTSHLTLALERGEIGGIGGWAWSSLQVQRPEWISSKFIFPLLLLGSTTPPELKDVPHILDLVNSEDERRALELIFAPDELGRPFFAPPDTPAVAVDLLRTAFTSLMVDGEFKMAVEKARLDVTFMDGRTLQRKIAELNDVNARVLELAKSATRKK